MLFFKTFIFTVSLLIALQVSAFAANCKSFIQTYQTQAQHRDSGKTIVFPKRFHQLFPGDSIVEYEPLKSKFGFGVSVGILTQYDEQSFRENTHLALISSHGLFRRSYTVEWVYNLSANDRWEYPKLISWKRGRITLGFDSRYYPSRHPKYDSWGFNQYVLRDFNQNNGAISHTVN